jgi:photoprotection regulator FRP-like protein
MASLPDPADQDGETKMRDMKWSQAEKIIARKAFDQALDREFEVVIREAKQMAGRIEQPSDLWELEGYLTRSRKEIDRMYDYRYSVLPLVFGNLIREGRLSEEELHGLADDKLAHIRSYAKLFSRLDTVA